MPFVHENVKVELFPGTPSPIVYLSENDIGDTVAFELVYKGQPVNIPGGNIIKFSGTKKDGLGFTVNSSNVSGNVVSFIVSQDMTSCPGVVEAEISIISNNSKHGTCNVVLIVEKNPHSDGTQDGSYPQIISEMRALVNQIEGDAETASNAANTAVAAKNSALEIQQDVYQYTASAIDDWLDAHPEATTTVQDGSIAEVKLADDLYSAYASIGANLFDPTLNSIEVNGLTYEFDFEEKTYHIYGTASANTYLYLGIFTLPAGTYKLLAMTEQGTGDTFRVNLYNQTTSQLITQDFGSGRVFTLAEETRCRLAPYINSGVTLDTIIKPMITKHLRATIDDYTPYLYGKARLDLNVSALKYDLYKSKLNGDKTNNVNTGWLYDVAKNWIDNASHIFYGYNNNLFWDVTLATDNKYPLTCSVFACAMILGIKFTDSKYNGLPSNISTEFGYKDDVLIDKMRGDFISHHLAKYFIEKGFAFIPVEGLKNIHTGDVLFYNLGQDDAPNFFMSIDHTAVFAYHVSDTTYYVWEVGDNSGPHLASKQYSSNDVVLAARPPYNIFGESKRRITLSTQDFTGPIALTSLFALTHGYSANMWKVYLMGPAYGKGVSASSVYLIRTNGNGAVSEKVALFEGTGSSVRKLDENYNIIDSGGYYNQPVTILVEWLG